MRASDLAGPVSLSESPSGPHKCNAVEVGPRGLTGCLAPALDQETDEGVVLGRPDKLTIGA